MSESGFNIEDARELIAAIERWGGVEDHVDGDGYQWRNPRALRAAMKGLEAALRSRARRESRAAMEALDLRVAAHLASRHS